MRTVMALYAFAVIVRLALIGLFPDPAYVDSFYYVNVARALQAGHGFNIDFIWTFVDLGGSIPGRSEPADPEQRPLDAAGVARPGPVSGRLRDDGLGVRIAVRAHRLAGRPDDLGVRPRSRRPPGRRPRRRAPRRSPGRARVHGPARQLLALSTDRPRCAVARCAWAEGQHPIVRGRRRTGRPGDARPERRDPGRRGTRPALPVGQAPGLADAPIRAVVMVGRRRRRSVCSFSSWLRGGPAS